MTKNMIAYFKTENNALEAEAGLERIRAEDLFVDEMPEQGEDDIFVPIIVADSGTMSGSPSNAFDAGNSALVEGLNGDETPYPDDDQPITHLLQGKIAEDDYEEAIKIIHKAKGYVRRNEK